MSGTSKSSHWSTPGTIAFIAVVTCFSPICPAWSEMVWKVFVIFWSSLKAVFVLFVPRGAAVGARAWARFENLSPKLSRSRSESTVGAPGDSSSRSDWMVWVGDLTAEDARGRGNKASPLIKKFIASLPNKNLDIKFVSLGTMAPLLNVYPGARCLPSPLDRQCRRIALHTPLFAKSSGRSS